MQVLLNKIWWVLPLVSPIRDIKYSVTALHHLSFTDVWSNSEMTCVSTTCLYFWLVTAEVTAMVSWVVATTRWKILLA